MVFQTRGILEIHERPWHSMTIKPLGSSWHFGANPLLQEENMKRHMGGCIISYFNDQEGGCCRHMRMTQNYLGIQATPPRAYTFDHA